MTSAVKVKLEPDEFVDLWNSMSEKEKIKFLKSFIPKRYMERLFLHAEQLGEIFGERKRRIFLSIAIFVLKNLREKDEVPLALQFETALIQGVISMLQDQKQTIRWIS